MSIGVNLRVTYHTSIGGRKYQEDFFSVAYQETEHDGSLQFAFFGIYDGHGGAEASLYAKEHLMDTIVSQKLFWSENDDDVLRAIREGYIQTHYSMWREQEKWPKTSSGLPSTAGTTASIAFIRRGKIYVGHVGDSAIVLGYQKEKKPICEEDSSKWGATLLTVDHKPETYAEKMRIMSCGGKVITKSGVPRVVWNRPRIGHKGPVRRSTPIDEIPFLAVARSLGDLWSYNSVMNEFVVSPDPDVSVIEIDPKKYRCLIFGTDGLWNVMSPKNAVEIVQATEMENVRIALEGGRDWKNPSKLLVDEALQRWSKSNMKADNTSVVIIMLDPPGPRKLDMTCSMRTSTQPVECEVICTQPNVSLFDHASRELIDISQVTCQASSNHNNENLQHHSYFESATPASYQDITYTEGFDESYNSFLNISFNNEHSYTNYASANGTQQYTMQQYHNRQPQQHDDVEGCTTIRSDENDEHNRTNFEDTYSLTNLRTKSERVLSDSMQASASSLSSPLYAQQEHTGNVILIENFHGYSLTHMSPRPNQQSYVNSQYHHTSYHQRYDEPIDRYDYYNHHYEEQIGCSYSQSYSSRNLSEHNYQRNADEYPYLEKETDSPVVVETIGVAESVENVCYVTSPAVENVTVDPPEVSCGESQQQQHHSWPVNRSENRDEQDGAGIQINEISSSDLNTLSTTHKTISQSSINRIEGDIELEATSSNVICMSAEVCSTASNTARIERKKRKSGKSFKNMVKIVYETRSNQRSHRTKAQQENFNSKTIRKKFTKFLRKNATVRSVLGFKKSSKSGNFSSMDNSGADASSNSINTKGAREQTCVEKRVLRSMDQIKVRTCRTVESTSPIDVRNHAAIQQKSNQPATETVRKISKRQILLRKVTLDAKRVRR
ncbi:uncharacterized protein LOC129778653 [Toxorhynchites rutilus septentrionalis]|uniref:uncharacterized protein LOC129778653 n=1 Tax=Toxorhynchites rutilus septentrionalis TaxID=329112 RepID=UPI002478CFD2|nr:uncharacterized protein LOC129778653 [Toxorhynchites rutilus septentrionalis]